MLWCGECLASWVWELSSVLLVGVSDHVNQWDLTSQWCSRRPYRSLDSRYPQWDHCEECQEPHAKAVGPPMGSLKAHWELNFADRSDLSTLIHQGSHQNRFCQEQNLSNKCRNSIYLMSDKVTGKIYDCRDKNQSYLQTYIRSTTPTKRIPDRLTSNCRHSE